MCIESSTVGGAKGQNVKGDFKTAPRADEPERVVFTVSTCQAYPDQDAAGGGYKIYSAMLKLDPRFFVHTGDIVYYDKLAKNMSLARWHWARMYSLPTNVGFHRQVASYFIKDDHDTWMNDCWPGQKTKFMGDFTFEQGLGIFLEQVPMSEKTYRTFRWGPDLQIWLVEGRDFRSPNTMPDGPDKTIWGKEQKAWFKRTVQESDATFRILCSPTPIVGPDRTNKRDNHSNKAFKHEGDELREFISKQKNMYVVCGDRHWQYVSVDAKTGVREYSCGSASDEHAGGWSNDMRYPEHRYLNVIGGFLAVIVDRSEGQPTVTFRHYSVDGDILNEDRFTVQ
jgi:alkaline phosphatase D